MALGRVHTAECTPVPCHIESGTVSLWGHSRYISLIFTTLCHIHFPIFNFTSHINWPLLHL